MSALFDQDLLRQRVKTRLKNWPQHDILYRQTADEIRDRVRDIKRDLPHMLDISWQNPVADADLQAEKSIQQVKRLTPWDYPDGMLSITPHSYDVVISQLVLHWADDPGLMLKQYFFALKPDGVMLACLLGGDSLMELRSVLGEVEQELYGGISPRVSPMMALQDIAGLMQQTGFALPVVDYDRITLTYPDLKTLLADLRGLGQGNVLQQRRTKPVSKKFWQRAEEIYRERYRDARGRLVVTLDVIYVLGWAPHPSQPQPKKRGSATVHLGEALKQ